MEEVYTTLSKHRDKPTERFVKHFLHNIVSEV